MDKYDCIYGCFPPKSIPNFDDGDSFLTRRVCFFTDRVGLKTYIFERTGSYLVYLLMLLLYKSNAVMTRDFIVDLQTPSTCTWNVYLQVLLHYIFK